MEVVVPMAAADFNFDSTCSSPYMSAPSTPKRFGDFYFSAPTSPSGASAIYNEFKALSKGHSSSSSAIPFDWEEKPGTPKKDAAQRTRNDDEEEEDDFAFDFSGQLDPSYITAAEELFEQGKIRPLKPPPRMQAEDLPSSKSPKSPRRMFREAFSPRQKKDMNPFAAAMEEARKGTERAERGRERAGPSSQNSNRRSARSLSPYRVSDFGLDDPLQSGKAAEKPAPPSAAPPKSGSKKWSIKDFLLFRSASEGRVSRGKDPLRKFSIQAKTKAEDVKNSSFRSTESSGSMRRGRVSAHELHYTANRAVSEEQRRKTFLPYRQGLLGCLGFSPTAHGLAKGFQSITRR
ncbi:uncharacterized protein [Aristolochia californica]|uniref:uncharacterized protein n=1 Tax=Aristolochia californica TaxID=171875 RepID=UPI0035DD267D